MTSPTPPAVGASDAIDIRTVSKVFGSGDNRVAAVDGVSVRIAKNEFFTLLGPPGAARPRCSG